MLQVPWCCFPPAASSKLQPGGVLLAGSMRGQERAGHGEGKCSCLSGRAKEQLRGKTEAALLVQGSWQGLGGGELIFSQLKDKFENARLSPILLQVWADFRASLYLWVMSSQGELLTALCKVFKLELEGTIVRFQE